MVKFSAGQPTANQQQQALSRLKQCRDQILGLSWYGYLNHGRGAIRFQVVNGGGKIFYTPCCCIADHDVLKLIDQTDPALAAVVLCDYGSCYDIITLSGPQKPPECYGSILDRIDKESSF